MSSEEGGVLKGKTDEIHSFVKRLQYVAFMESDGSFVLLTIRIYVS